MHEASRDERRGSGRVRDDSDALRVKSDGRYESRVRAAIRRPRDPERARMCDRTTDEYRQVSSCGEIGDSSSWTRRDGRDVRSVTEELDGVGSACRERLDY